MKYLRFLILLFLLFPLMIVKGESVDNPAETPWPMHQQNPQRTGQSPFLGPAQEPELLLTAQLPIDCTAENGGISIALNGDLMLSLGGCLYRFDPISKSVIWTSYGGSSRSVALVADDGYFYWGYANSISKISPDGETVWNYELDNNYVFGSSPTFGYDGNIYFVHEGLWSVAPEGVFWWHIPYGYPFSHASPAIGSDGTIYAGGSEALSAYSSTGDVIWSIETPHQPMDNPPVVGPDDTIYLPQHNSVVNAIDPSGTIKWSYQAPEAGGYVTDGIAVTQDGTIYFSLQNETKNSFNALDSNGNLKWNIQLPTNDLTGEYAFNTYAITADRDGNAFFCTRNSRCYGVRPDGTVMWEYEFPLVESIIVKAEIQPFLGGDGLLYLVDNHFRLYAFADPEMYPVLRASHEKLEYLVASETLPFETTISITSTFSTIEYTASISNTEWLSISNPEGTTPGELKVSIDPTKVNSGNYFSEIRLKTENKVGELIIPVQLDVGTSNGMNNLFIPISLNNYSTSKRIMYISNWFTKLQFINNGLYGNDRQVAWQDFKYPSFVEYSPDSQKAAFSVYLDGKNLLRVFDTRTGEIISDIEASGTWPYPSWSSDSNELIFRKLIQADDHKGEIFRVNADGSNLKRLTYNDVQEGVIKWSPSGETIAYEVDLGGTYIMNADGSDARLLVDENYRDVPEMWSPDERYLLIRSREGYRERDQLWIYDFQTNTFKFLVEKLAYSEYGGTVDWSPLSDRIAYVKEIGLEAETELYVMRPDGSEIVNLTNNLDRYYDPNWSLDSQWIAFVKEPHNEDADIYLVSRDGAEMRKLTPNIGNDRYIGWMKNK